MDGAGREPDAQPAPWAGLRLAVLGVLLAAAPLALLWLPAGDGTRLVEAGWVAVVVLTVPVAVAAAPLALRHGPTWRTAKVAAALALAVYALVSPVPMVQLPAAAALGAAAVVPHRGGGHGDDARRHG